MTIKEIAVMFHNRARVLRKLGEPTALRMETRATVYDAKVRAALYFDVIDKAGKMFRVTVSQLEG